MDSKSTRFFALPRFQYSDSLKVYPQLTRPRLVAIAARAAPTCDRARQRDRSILIKIGVAKNGGVPIGVLSQKILPRPTWDPSASTEALGGQRETKLHSLAQPCAKRRTLRMRTLLSACVPSWLSGARTAGTEVMTCRRISAARPLEK